MVDKGWGDIVMVVYSTIHKRECIQFTELNVILVFFFVAFAVVMNSLSTVVDIR